MDILWSSIFHLEKTSYYPPKPTPSPTSLKHQKSLTHLTHPWSLKKVIIGKMGVQKPINQTKITIVTKELQKKLAKVINMFQIDASVLTIILVGIREKSNAKNCSGCFNK